jgi:hypothetical protein
VRFSITPTACRRPESRSRILSIRTWRAHTNCSSVDATSVRQLGARCDRRSSHYRREGRLRVTREHDEAAGTVAANSSSVASDQEADALYDRWRREYEVRRRAFHEELIRTQEEAFQEAVEQTRESLVLPPLAACARKRRATFNHKFCMLLWSRKFDEVVFNENTGGVDLGHPHEYVTGLMHHKATNFRPRIARLTVRLDFAGFFSLMLYPSGLGDAPPEPLVIEAPEGPLDLVAPARMDMWFHFFTGFIELADAIIIEGNYGRGLFEELEQLRHQGLSNRVLLFDNNNELYRFDNAMRWPLEKIGEAVAYAAAQDAATPSSSA